MRLYARKPPSILHLGNGTSLLIPSLSEISQNQLMEARHRREKSLLSKWSGYASVRRSALGRLRRISYYLSIGVKTRRFGSGKGLRFFCQRAWQWNRSWRALNCVHWVLCLLSDQYRMLPYLWRREIPPSANANTTSRVE